MKCMVLLLCVHLSVVWTLRDADSHPLLFESEKDRTSMNQYKVHSVKEDQQYPVKQSQRNLKDIGYATNCGNPAHNFTLTWDPKVVNPSRGVVFHLNMTMGTDFSVGTMEVSVYTGGSSEPFITDTIPVTCGLIKVKFPQVKCPMKKGDFIDLIYSLPDLTALPPGSYKLKADIKDEQKKDVLCAELTVEIKE